MIDSNYSNPSSPQYSRENDTFSTGKNSPSSSKKSFSNHDHSLSIHHSDAEKENVYNSCFPSSHAQKETSCTGRSNTASSEPSLFQRIMQETLSEFGTRIGSSRSSFYPPASHSFFQSSSDYRSIPMTSTYLGSTSTAYVSSNSAAPKRKIEEVTLNPQEKRKMTQAKAARAQENLVALRNETIKMGRRIDHFTQTFTSAFPSSKLSCREITPTKLNPPQKLSKKELEIMKEESLTEQAHRTQKRFETVLEIVLNETTAMSNKEHELSIEYQQLQERNARLELENARLLKLLNEQKE